MSDSLLPLGKLEKVRVRDAWPDEARNFTPWLAGDGLALLGEELGVDLKVIRKEHPVGRYSLDLLATQEGLDNDQAEAQLIVIENQFGSTDHDHLGKLLTYASGVGEESQGAKTVIWIAEDFKEEHRRAIDWLNEVSQSGVRFYAVQLELYRIGNSDAAPSLNILVRPNEVLRARREAPNELNASSERNLFYVEYWTAYKAYCADKGAIFSLQTPRPDYWISSSLGRSGVHISFIANRRDKWIGCELLIRDVSPESTFRKLEIDRNEIDPQIPGLKWELTSVKSAKLHLVRPEIPSDKSQWSQQFEWLFEQGEKFYKVFAPRLRAMR